MISLKEYQSILEEAKDQIARFERAINYRTIQLIGATDLRRGRTLEEYALIENDKVLNDLQYNMDLYKKRVNYIQEHAEYPCEEHEIDLFGPFELADF